MSASGPAMWMFAIAGGAVILFCALVYGIMRNRDRTLAERRTTEAASRAEYSAEDKDKS
ncbi:hypothetical protein O9Z70_03295 [Devosia sp. YIM 151766]|uniref:hypothetical protein n=1 Tax=Devosia sp. YIM 151766 TaxID=3017325 RepID=UPI00255D0514|nr:hypothetical protein [Devosia sp. YIM 151766]WIY53577.1 hypothetical protein O9Z70_03295 [Devosia sp. YIM 151766]